MGAAAATHSGSTWKEQKDRGARADKGLLLVSMLFQAKLGNHVFCCHTGSAGEEIVLCRTQAVQGDGSRVQTLLHELFSLQDLNSDGLLDEEELVALNERIAVLHYGKDIDREDIRDRFVALFRERLDPDGLPVPFETFCEYMSQALEGIDRDSIAQEMIVEQFVAEAALARSFCEEAKPAHATVTDEVITKTVSKRSSREIRPLIRASECKPALLAKPGFEGSWVHAL